VGLKIYKMKKIFITLFSLSSLLFLSCDSENTDNVSRVTNYPLITVLGDDPIFVPQGGSFTDPGAVATEGENTIDYETTFLGNYRGGTTFDSNVPDEYGVTYTATNKDGFKASASRRVIVYKNGDLVTSIEGIYKCSVSRNGSNPVTAQNVKYVYIWKNTDGTYGISDAFGGWYQYHRGFGIGYITPGGIINAIDITTNTFTYPGNPLSNSGFGGVANITDVNVNPTTKTIKITCTWTAPTAYTFISTLTQVQL
jgi:Domain of unknown function (DUF5011)/Domain of unknown function (DUF5012)